MVGPPSDSLENRLHGFAHVAIALDIERIPAALVCNCMFVGTRPYKVLEAALAECLVTEKTDTQAVGQTATR